MTHTLTLVALWLVVVLLAVCLLCLIGGLSWFFGWYLPDLQRWEDAQDARSADQGDGF